MQKLPDVCIWTQEASLKRCSTPYPAQGGGGSGVYARNTKREYILEKWEDVVRFKGDLSRARV